jgi:anti-sigma factor RsiW
MHEEWTDKLSDYLDGELSAEEHGAVAAHLRSCAACTAVLNDLKRVVARAQEAGHAVARPPQADLWAGIAARIEPARAFARAGSVAPFARRAQRRITVTLPQLAAAALVIAAVSGGVAWKIAGGLEGRREAGAASAAPSGSGQVSHDSRPVNPDGADMPARRDAEIVPVGMADAQYDAAVADLEKALKLGRGRLDASTIAIVEHNLQIIDQAIDQAREALVSDPANSYLNSHLVETRRRKLDLLRRATALTTETN